MTEKENNKKETNKVKVIVLVLLVIMLGGLVSYLMWFFLVEQNTKTTVKTTPTITCNDLILLNESEKTNLPFTPILEAIIGGDYDSNKEICEIFLDGKTSGRFKPIDGKCKFDSLKILVSGKYDISYKASSTSGESCEKKITLSSGPKIEAEKTGEEEGYTLYDTP